MKGKWKVSSQNIKGITNYISYRVLDTSKTIHSGNIETFGVYSTNREHVEILCKQLNSREER